MLIDPKDGNDRINSDDNLINKIGEAPEGPSEEEAAALIDKFIKGGGNYQGKRGRRFGQTNLSTEARAMIAATSIIATGAQAAQAFDVGEKHAYDLKQGHRGQAAREKGVRDQELVEKTKDILGEVHETAADRLMATLGLLNKDKIATVKKATDLSRIARDLATIVDKSKPQSTSDGTNVHFHVYKPEQKEEAAYDVIDT